jgi:hypothetical protein
MREVAGVVQAEFFTASAVRFVADWCDGDEAGVLAGGRRDEDVVVSGTPVERLS